VTEYTARNSAETWQAVSAELKTGKTVETSKVSGAQLASYRQIALWSLDDVLTQLLYDFFKYLNDDFVMWLIWMNQGMRNT
jgi:hypothetical protein